MRIAAGAAVIVAAAVAAALLLHGASPARPARPPVVMLVLDKFPVDALRSPDGRIDTDASPTLPGSQRPRPGT